MSGTPYLSLRDLRITFHSGDRDVEALRGIDLDLMPGEIHALVGESGSGKSVTARALLGLTPTGAAVSADRMQAGDIDLLRIDDEGFRRIRGAEISMIFQEPGKHLNPAFRIGTQISEVIRVHDDASRVSAMDRARKLVDLVGLGSDDRVLMSYPHELSGGMKQRAMIAMALSCNPQLLIADEPTTALDVTVQSKILKLIKRLNKELGMAVLFISHDLGVVHEISDRVSIIYSGRIVESASRGDLFGDPRHPYTKMLLASNPDKSRRGKRLIAIPGIAPDSEAVPSGCAFHPRCPFAEEVCENVGPKNSDADERFDHPTECHFVGEKPLDIHAGVDNR